MVYCLVVGTIHSSFWSVGRWRSAGSWVQLLVFWVIGKWVRGGVVLRCGFIWELRLKHGLSDRWYGKCYLRSEETGISELGGRAKIVSRDLKWYQIRCMEKWNQNRGTGNSENGLRCFSELRYSGISEPRYRYSENGLWCSTERRYSENGISELRYIIAWGRPFTVWWHTSPGFSLYWTLPRKQWHHPSILAPRTRPGRVICW
jgi:hypothetical protein